MKAAAAAALVAALLAAAAGAWALLSRRATARGIRIVDPHDATVVDSRGAVRSVQAAEAILPARAVDEIWTPMHLERLARTYWRFLSRCTLGLIRVVYTPDERFVVLVARPFVLLRFQQPEYEMDADFGLVRWRIESGVLVARRGRGGDGWLQLSVRRRPGGAAGEAVVHVEVEVANFYPSIASGLSTWLYQETQSRIHVIVTHGFLRSLARMDLAESRVGRFADAEAAVALGLPPEAGDRPRAGAGRVASG
jgi:hypothetical protein